MESFREQNWKDEKEYAIQELLSMFNCESKDTLLMRIEDFLYNMSPQEVLDMRDSLAEQYPEFFPESYSEVEDIDDFYKNGDPDDCDPAGGYGLRSHE